MSAGLDFRQPSQDTRRRILSGFGCLYEGAVR